MTSAKNVHKYPFTHSYSFLEIVSFLDFFQIFEGKFFFQNIFRTNFFLFNVNEGSTIQPSVES